MAGVETHARDAVLFGIVVGAAVAAFLYQRFHSLQLAGGAALTVFILIFVGAMLPDTDVKSSKPYRWAVKWSTAGGALLIGYLAVENWRLYLGVLKAWVGGLLPDTIPVPAVALLFVGLAIVSIRLAAAEGIDRVTGSHRTRTHNPLVLTGVAILLAGSLWILLPKFQLVGRELRPYAAVGLPGALLVGSFIHLGRDKLS